MKQDKILRYWQFKRDRAKELYDENWNPMEKTVHKEYVEVLEAAIEALKAKKRTCQTCGRCSDYQEEGTRCPIEEHYALPKDGHCHLWEPRRKEQNNEQTDSV